MVVWSGVAADENLIQPEFITANTRPEGAASVDALQPRFVGALACSNAACHGNFQESQSSESLRFDEFHTWSIDPHSSSLLTLQSKRAQKILRQLRVLDEAGRVIESQAAERQWTNCLQCHDTTLPALTAIENSQFVQLSEGVSCEACHGPASKWLHRHYRKDWLTLTSLQKSESGFLNLDHPVTQAEKCVQCHVGQTSGEVNHDLLAAGHPALKWDLAWYQQRMPQHWHAARRGQLNESLQGPLQRWLLGQAVAAEAALQQLQRRAQQAVTARGTWPELSESACFACHHDIEEGQSWKQFRGLNAPSGNFGSLPWAPWELSLVPELIEQLESASANNFSGDYTELVQAMNSAVVPDPRTVSDLAEKSAQSLHAWIENLEFPSDDSIHAALLQLFEQEQGAWAVGTWERSAKFFFAVSAEYRHGGVEIPVALLRLRETLQYPRGKSGDYESPQQFRGRAANGEEHSPRAESLRLIQQMLKKPR